MRMRRNYVDGHLEAYQESGSSDYSPKTGQTIAAKSTPGKYNGGNPPPTAYSYNALLRGSRRYLREPHERRSFRRY